jgi:hypothetical protein
MVTSQLDPYYVAAQRISYSLPESLGQDEHEDFTSMLYIKALEAAAKFDKSQKSTDPAYRDNYVYRALHTEKKYIYRMVKRRQKILNLRPLADEDLLHDPQPQYDAREVFQKARENLNEIQWELVERMALNGGEFSYDPSRDNCSYVSANTKASRVRSKVRQWL